MSKKEQDAATLESIYGAFAKGDWEAWATHIDENSMLIEAKSLPYGGEFKGMAIINALKALGDAWEDFDYQSIETYYSEKSIMVYGLMHATGKATGRRVSMPLAERWVLDGHMVREVTAVYGDTALALEALTPVTTG